ncbi:hypothetical protein PIB30_099573 [Stylosanthes scabra]|uniref:Uncharacterized protein n=1 Tax=Stylosanthes scabra TaxID=79078 RepID=A0ABU6ZVI3_9FABA|nr:hypothetical protein [Stylosanthes scabra]
MWEGLLPKLTMGRIKQGCLTRLILVLQAGPEAEVQAEVEVQPEVGIVVGNEQEPEPVIVEIRRPLQPDQPTKPHGAEPEQPSTPQYNEVDDPSVGNSGTMLLDPTAVVVTGSWDQHCCAVP